MKKIFTLLLLVLLPFFIFSQVEIVSHDATKIYPDDTRVTYMTLSEFPTDIDFLEFVEKQVLFNDLIQRFSLYKNGSTCFFHSHKDITEEIIVEAINDAYYLYFTTEAYKPQKENPDNSISKEDYSKVFNQNNPDKLISKEDFDKFTEKERAGIHISKEEYEEAVARKKNEKSNEKENNKKFISQANIKPISALNQIKWEKGGIYEGFSPKDEILEKRTQNTKHFRKD
ncbi:MAG: hypothetical protein PHW82_14385, partial [Bacteroidales bacterium]|nr:hypothetical protein [Bacteroidales bacterium]